MLPCVCCKGQYNLPNFYLVSQCVAGCVAECVAECGAVRVSACVAVRIAVCFAVCVAVHVAVYRVMHVAVGVVMQCILLCVLPRSIRPLMFDRVLQSGKFSSCNFDVCQFNCLLLLLMSLIFNQRSHTVCCNMRALQRVLQRALQYVEFDKWVRFSN